MAASISEATLGAAEAIIELMAACGIPEHSDVSGVVLQVHHTTVVLLELVRAEEAEELDADAFERVRWGISLGRVQDGSTNVVLIDIRMGDLALNGDFGWLNWVAVLENDGQMQRSVVLWRQDQACVCEVAILEV